MDSMSPTPTTPDTHPSNEDVSQYLQIQWQDHFHMRDQTWKVLQYSILFFLGVVGLAIKGVDSYILIFGYIAVSLTALSGAIIALHHRRRQDEKFEIIRKFEEHLGLTVLMTAVLTSADKGLLGIIRTTHFIVVIQLAVFVVSLILLFKQLGICCSQ